MNICRNRPSLTEAKPKDGMAEQTNAPAISDMDQPSPNENAGKTLNSLATLSETQDALQANNAERMTPDEADELSNN